jgi:hypothetical protein
MWYLTSIELTENVPSGINSIKLSEIKNQLSTSTLALYFVFTNEKTGKIIRFDIFEEYLKAKISMQGFNLKKWINYILQGNFAGFKYGCFYVIPIKYKYFSMIKFEKDEVLNNDSPEYKAFALSTELHYYNRRYGYLMTNSVNDINVWGILADSTSRYISWDYIDNLIAIYSTDSNFRLHKTTYSVPEKYRVGFTKTLLFS